MFFLFRSCSVSKCLQLFVLAFVFLLYIRDFSYCFLATVLAHLVLSFNLHADRKPEKEIVLILPTTLCMHYYASVHNSKTNFSILQKTNNCEVGATMFAVVLNFVTAIK